RAERSHSEYIETAERLSLLQRDNLSILQSEGRTSLRKRVQQVARSLLPNEAESPLVFTANIRAWRHILSMRASEHAETQIRELAVRAFLCLRGVAPNLFDDFFVHVLSDGT